jgi:hypothetical protein
MNALAVRRVQIFATMLGSWTELARQQGWTPELKQHLLDTVNALSTFVEEVRSQAQNLEVRHDWHD